MVATINAGTLQIGSGGNTGSVANASTNTISDNGVLAFDHSDAVTYSNSISGNGSLLQMGSGTLVLNGANSYSGTTIVSRGMLEPLNTAALPGYAAPGLVSVAGGGTLSVASAGWASGDLNALLGANGPGFAAGSSLGIDTTGGNLSLTTSIGGGMALDEARAQRLAAFRHIRTPATPRSRRERCRPLPRPLCPIPAIPAILPSPTAPR